MGRDIHHHHLFLLLLMYRYFLFLSIYVVVIDEVGVMDVVALLLSPAVVVVEKAVVGNICVVYLVVPPLHIAMASPSSAPEVTSIQIQRTTTLTALINLCRGPTGYRKHVAYNSKRWRRHHYYTIITTTIQF